MYMSSFEIGKEGIPNVDGLKWKVGKLRLFTFSGFHVF